MQVKTEKSKKSQENLEINQNKVNQLQYDKRLFSNLVNLFQKKQKSQDNQTESDQQRKTLPKMTFKQSKEEIYKNAINHGLEQMQDQVSIRDIINSQLQQFSMTVIYDKQFYAVLVEIFTTIPAEDSNGKEEQLDQFVKRIFKNDQLILKSQAQQLLGQLRILRDLRQIVVLKRQGNTDMKALELTYALENQKTEQELVDEYNKNKEQLKMKIEPEAIKTIYFSQPIQYAQKQIENNNNNNNNIKSNNAEQQKVGQSDNISQLSEYLEEIYEQQKLDELGLATLMKEVDLIRTIVLKMNLKKLLGLDYVTVQPYGSTVSGFGQKTSDADVSINTNCFVPVIPFLTLLLNFIKKYCLSQEIQIEKLEVVDAKTPVLAYKHNGMSLDISLNNILGCINSRMLRALSDIDPIIPKLGIVIKTWAKANKLSTKDSLSSYSFILLMFFFLFDKRLLSSLFQQERKNSGLKNTVEIKRFKMKDEEKFTANLFYSSAESLRKHMKKSKEKSKAESNRKYVDDLSLGELFRDFIAFYKNENKRVISLDLHKSFQTQNSEYYFNIEDPFDTKHNPGMKSKGKEDFYKDAFKQAFTYLEEGKYQQLFSEKKK